MGRVERWGRCFLWVPPEGGERWDGPAGERVGVGGARRVTPAFRCADTHPVWWMCWLVCAFV